MNLYFMKWFWIEGWIESILREMHWYVSIWVSNRASPGPVVRNAKFCFGPTDYHQNLLFCSQKPLQWICWSYFLIRPQNTRLHRIFSFLSQKLRGPREFHVLVSKQKLERKKFSFWSQNTRLKQIKSCSYLISWNSLFIRVCCPSKVYLILQFIVKGMQL